MHIAWIIGHFFTKKPTLILALFVSASSARRRGDGARGKIGHNDTMCCGEGRKKFRKNEATVKKMGPNLLFFVILS